MENHNFQWENPLFLWSFSIATLNYQRVQETSIFSGKNQGFSGKNHVFTGKKQGFWGKNQGFFPGKTMFFPRKTRVFPGKTRVFQGKTNVFSGKNPGFFADSFPLLKIQWGRSTGLRRTWVHPMHFVGRITRPGRPGKHTKTYGQSAFLMGKLTISMAMFLIYSYVMLC